MMSEVASQVGTSVIMGNGVTFGTIAGGIGIEKWGNLGFLRHL